MFMRLSISIGGPKKRGRCEAPSSSLAAHAIETPKILRMSSNLANSSDQVGRNLMDHVQFELIAPSRNRLYPFRGTQSVTGIEAFREAISATSGAGFG